uniref:Ig-like domain-containing protein n=1 Tax=Pygocentrus nattereri TaxID=42514 RepID=A0AAR2LJK3_PYGNA
MIMTLKATSVAGLLLTLSGLEAIVHLTQEKSIDFTLGQDVQILCRRDGGSWSISWYQQKAGGTPTFILADSYRASGLPSRFTYTDNGSDEYLNINGVQAEDEAVYYCGCIICQSHHSAADQWAPHTKTSRASWMD